MIGEKKNKSCPPRSIFITFLLGCCVFFYIEHYSSALDTNDSTSISNTSTAISSSTSNWDRTVLTGLGTASSSDQEEKNLRVPTNSDNQDPTIKEYRRSNKHNKITENAPEEEKTILLRQQGILVMVMGEACNYHRWHLLWNSFLMHETKMESASAPFVMKDNRVWSQSTTSSLHHPNATNQEYQSKSNSFFVYASYDEPVSAANVSLSSCTSAGENGAMDKHKCCNCSYNATNTSSSTIFIPGTTWTQGRNKLIEEALHLERRFGQKYDYWLFLDDDVVFKCRNGKDAVMKNITNCNDICWNEFMDVLKDRSLVPQKATTVTLHRGKNISKQHYAASNADAMVAAFKREYVPYLLPYATLNVSESQWTSQAVLFCVMWSCFKQSTYFIPTIRVRNKAHRPYERGWNISSFQAATARNYDQYMSLHRGCDESKHYEQMSDVVNTSSVKELDNLIPAMNQSCDVLKQHFSDWAVQTVGLTAT